METALIVALTAAVMTMAGWLVTNRLSLAREDSARRREAEREFLQRQIQDLYGPLLGLIEHGREVYALASRLLPTESGRLAIERFSHSHTDIWRYLIENHFHPTNGSIRQILRSQLHLLEGDGMPESFKQFLRHDAHSEVLYGLWKSKGIDSLQVDGVGWPPTFETEVRQALEHLQARHRSLVSTIQGRRLSSGRDSGPQS